MQSRYLLTRRIRADHRASTLRWTLITDEGSRSRLQPIHQRLSLVAVLRVPFALRLIPVRMNKINQQRLRRLPYITLARCHNVATTRHHRQLIVTRLTTQFAAGLCLVGGGLLILTGEVVLQQCLVLWSVVPSSPLNGRQLRTETWQPQR